MSNRTTTVMALGAAALLLAALLPLSGSAGPSGVASSDAVSITIHSHDDATQITYQIAGWSYEQVTIQGEPYARLHLADEPILLEEGAPELPIICRSLLIPDTARMEVQVLASSYTERTDIQVVPSKGNLLRTVNPDDVPYTFGPTYDQDAWYPESIAWLREPYVLRDFRGQVVVVSPFQYNPATGTLRIYDSITVEVTASGTDTRNCLYRSAAPDAVDADFATIYGRQFLNFDMTRYTPVEEEGNMLIITYDNFYHDMVPFLHWKLAKGIPTEMVNVSTIGSAANIKAYIANYYAQKGLTFVLLVGDATQVPPYLVSGSASDQSLSYITADHYPDLFVGRFSAETNAQVQTQVQRSIEYERDAQVGAAWYHQGMGVASNQGPGDDGEYDNQHIDNIRTDLLAFTFTTVDQIYDPSGTAAMVTAGLNAGRSIINYCGHGSMTSWGSTGFSNTHVNALQNANMLPHILSVACNNGEFDGGTCFAEAWLRATQSGEPTGAIGTYMSTVSQSWNPPMDAQDESVDILCEHYSANKKTTLCGLYFNGAMHMNDEYGSSGYGETDYWTCFGDPSLQVRTDVPAAMAVSHNPAVPYGSTFFEVDVTGFAGARCALSRAGELYGSALTDAAGHAFIEFDEPIGGEGDLTLVVTAFNKQTYSTPIILYAGFPPADPVAPTGVTFGNVNTSYSFSAVTTDPDGDNVSYRFDWGDNSTSDWVGPFPSGTAGSASHIWTAGGDYEVRCQAKDRYGLKSNWSAALPLRIAKPEITVPRIAGGLLGITVTIENSGDADAGAIPWTVDLSRAQYSYPCHYAGHFAGNISGLVSGASEKVSCRPLYGFGKVKIVVHAYDIEVIATGMVLGPVIVVR